MTLWDILGCTADVCRLSWPFIGDSVNVEMIDNVLLLDQKASGKPRMIHLRIRDVVVGETWSYNLRPVNLYRSGYNRYNDGNAPARYRKQAKDGPYP